MSIDYERNYWNKNVIHVYKNGAGLYIDQFLINIRMKSKQLMIVTYTINKNKKSITTQNQNSVI